MMHGNPNIKSNNSSIFSGRPSDHSSSDSYECNLTLRSSYLSRDYTCYVQG